MKSEYNTKIMKLYSSVKNMSDDASILDAHILSIIQRNKIFQQSDLQKMLKARGFDIPQATLSRRLQKLNIAKVSKVYKVIDLNINVPLILKIQVSAFGQIVLHTRPGNASSIASYIDQKYVFGANALSKNNEILGTIAGDDTILIVTKDKQSTNSVLEILRNEFPYIFC